MRLTIKTKLAVLFLAIFALWGASTAKSLYNLSSANDSYSRAVNVDVEHLLEVEDIVTAKLNVRMIVGRILVDLPNAPADHIPNLRKDLEAQAAEVDGDVYKRQGGPLDCAVARHLGRCRVAARVGRV